MKKKKFFKNRILPCILALLLALSGIASLAKDGGLAEVVAETIAETISSGTTESETSQESTSETAAGEETSQEETLQEETSQAGTSDEETSREESSKEEASQEETSKEEASSEQETSAESAAEEETESGEGGASAAAVSEDDGLAAAADTSDAVTFYWVYEEKTETDEDTGEETTEYVLTFTATAPEDLSLDTNGSITTSVSYGWYTNTPWYNSYGATVTKVVFDESMKDVPITSMSFWFGNFTALTALEGTENVDTSALTSLRDTFYNCSALASLDLSSWDTSKVTTLYETFRGCSSLTSLDLSSWDISNVTTLRDTFCLCSALTSLSVSGWDTSSVTTLYQTFYGCSSLASLDVSKWDTSNVTTLYQTFYSCKSLTSLDLSSWNTSKVTELYRTFYYCSSLTSLNVSKWDTSNVTTLYCTFRDCSSLTSLDLSSWDTSKVTTLYQTFCNCKALASLDVSKWNTSNVTTLCETFYYCSALASLSVSGWDTSKVTTLYQAFYYCSKLTELDVSGWDTSNVTTLYQTFYYCSKLTELDVSGWDTSSVTTLYRTFRDCGSLTELDASSWDTSNVTTLYQTFLNCSSLESLDVSSWDTSNVTTLHETFYNCAALTGLDVSGWDTSNVTTLYETFYNCSVLTGLDVSGWDTSNVTTLYRTFYNCSSLGELDVSGWDTSNVTTLEQTFYNCAALTGLDVSGWDTSAAASMISTFCNCSGLTYLDVSGWNTSKVTRMEHMFQNCSGLTKLDVSGFDVSAVTIGYAGTGLSSMFYGCSSLTSLDLSSWNPESLSGSGMDYMFQNCSSLTFLDISGMDTTKIISMNQAFSGCTSLATFVIGAKTTLCSNWGMESSWSWAQMSTAKTVTAQDDDGETYTYTDFTMVTTSQIQTMSNNGSITDTETFSRQADVSFYANGGTPTSTVSIYNGVVYGQDITVKEPTRTGYTFAGWWTQRTGGTELAEGYSETVYYDSDGNVTTDTENYSSYETIVYTSDGEVSDAALVSQSIYYAHWTPVTYTVILKSNGTADADVTVKMSYGDFIKLDDAAGFSYSGYVLSGWSTSRNGDVVYDGDETVGNLTTIDGDTIVLYAQWTSEDNYATVGFDSEGNYEDVVSSLTSSAASADEIVGPNSLYIEKGSALGTLSSASCEGLTFDGWRIYLDSSMSGYSTIVSKIYAGTPYDTEIVAETEDENGNALTEHRYYYYTLTFTSDGQEVTYNIVWYALYNYSYTYDESEEKYVQSTESYTWTYYIEADSDTVISSLLLDSDNTVTLSAVWSGAEKIIISFYDGLDSDTPYSQKRVTSGSEVGSLPAFDDSYNGSKSLFGWYLAAQTDNFDYDSYEALTSDTVLTTDDAELDSSGVYRIKYYAHWGYKPSLLTNGGTLDTATEYAVQVSSSYEMTFVSVSRDGYTFSYWTLADGTIIYSGVTYNANGTVTYDGTTYESITALVNSGAALSYADSTGKVTIDLSYWGTEITANWTEAEKITVSLNPDGYVYSSGDEIEEGSATYNYNTSLTLYTTGTLYGLSYPSMDGYEFLGWTIEVADSSGNKNYLTQTDDEGSVSVVYITNGTSIAYLLKAYESYFTDSILSLCAVWSKEEYTITFDPNGGVMYGTTGEEGQTVTESVCAGYYTGTIPSAKLTKYVFVGWYTGCEDGCTGLDIDTESESFTGTQLTSGTYISGDVTYHAHYEYLIQDVSNSSVSYSYGVEWANASTEDVDNTDGHLNFHPTTGEDQTATLHIWFHLSNTKSKTGYLPAESLKIYIPVSVFTDEDGNALDETNLSVSLPEAAYDEDGNIIAVDGVEYSYYTVYDEDGSPLYYVITNNQEIPSGGGFELDISYTVSPLDVEGGAVDAEGNYIDGYSYYINNNVEIKITVDTDADGEADVENEVTLSLEMHTQINASASKSYVSIYYDWDEYWGEEPEDSDDYVYVIWSLTARFTNCSQTGTYYWDESSFHDGTIVKWLKKSSGVYYAATDDDGNEVTGTTSATGTLSSSSSSSTDYVLVKYPASDFTEESLEESKGLTLENQAVLCVVWDAEDDSGNNYTEYFAVEDSEIIPYTADEEEEEEGYETVESTNIYKNKNSLTKTNTYGDVQTVAGAQDILVNNEESVKLVWEVNYTGSSRTTTYTGLTETTYAHRTITVTDGASGDLLCSDTEDTSMYLWEPDTGNDALYDSDYQITQLEILVKDYFYNGTVDSDISDYGNVMVYVRYQNTTEFTFFKEVELESVGTDADYTTVLLPSGVAEYKVVYETDAYKTSLSVLATVEILPTSHIISIVGEDLKAGVDTLFKNIAHCSVLQDVDYEPETYSEGNDGYDSTVYTAGTVTETDEDGNVTSTTVTETASDGTVTITVTDSDGNVTITTIEYDSTENTQTVTKETITEIYSGSTYTSANYSCEEVIWRLTKTDTYQYTVKYAAAQGNVVYDAAEQIEGVAMYLSAWNYNTTDGCKTYMTSGVFYDLLPTGTTVDISTVFGMVITDNLDSSGLGDRSNSYDTLYNAWVSGSDGYLDSVLYEVTFIADYEDTGRTMMVITWSAPDDTKITGIQFWYRLETTYENLKIYGTTKNNIVAFVNTSTNAAAPEKLYDSREAIIDTTDAAYDAYSTLDSKYSSYISYATATENYIPVSFSTWGFDKSVRGEGSGYDTSDVTSAGGTYSYKLTYSQSSAATSQNIVFIDVLEDGTVSGTSSWQGTLVSVDTSAAAALVNGNDEDGEATCSPVVYYSTADASLFYETTKDDDGNETIREIAEKYRDVSDTSVWTKASEYTGSLSDVTAVLVDCSKDTDGNNFVLSSDYDSIYITITLTAPSSDTDCDEHFEEIYGTDALNEGYVYVTTIAAASSSDGTSDTETGTSRYISDSASITFKDITDVETEKSSDPETGTEEDPAEVADGTELTYILAVTNTNDEDTIYNIVVEDVIDSALLVTLSDIKVAIVTSSAEEDTDSTLSTFTNDETTAETTTAETETTEETGETDSSDETATETETSEETGETDSGEETTAETETSETSEDDDEKTVSTADLISSLSLVSILSAQRVSLESETVDEGTKLTFTISSLNAGETLYIVIPVTPETVGAVIDNTAKITSVEGNTVEIKSDTTWHEIVPYTLPETGSRSLLMLICAVSLMLAVSVTLRRRLCKKR